jgi:BirA family transcriptional regulator, biotin operon repressor / biotin---[acetyl-CoA-carboxylase] ligase
MEMEEASSTNDLAIELLKSSAIPEGTAILAHSQTRGRGQREQGWESEPGKNITTSIIFYPRFLHVRQQFELSIAVALGIHDFVEREAGPEAAIKWPNDIYYKDLKIAGVLIENTVQGAHLHTSVTGIGININQEVFTSAAPNPVSLRQITGKDYNIRTCFEALCSCLEGRYLQLKAGKTELLRREYLKKLYRFGIYSEYLYQNLHIRAKITGISTSGRLQLESEELSTLEADLKEIKFL